MGKTDKSASCSNELFKRLASELTSRRYEKGQTIFAQGEAADAMFRIAGVAAAATGALVAWSGRQRALR